MCIQRYSIYFSGSRLVGAEIEHESSVNRQGSEEDMERMAEVVKDTVVKLFEDEEKPLVDIESDKWYYRDPQGVVQGKLAIKFL